MKKFTALLIIVTLLFSLISCGDEEYPPVQSSELEKQVVMTVEYDGEKYDVRYELYRAIFLNLRESVDKGDTSVWSGENKAEYIEKIDEIIKKRASDIYAALHVSKKIGADPYSKEFDEAVKESIRLSVNGGTYDNQKITGFGGDYDKYLESLKKDYINYSVQDLLLRYNFASIKIFEYYVGNLNGEFLEESTQGKLEYTMDDVKSFYFSDDCVRVLKAHLSKEVFDSDYANTVKEKIEDAAKFGDTAVAECIIGLVGAIAPTDIFCGDIIGRHNLDEAFYSELENTAFELPLFETSEIMEVSTAFDDAYVIIYKTTKSESNFSEYYDKILSAYVQNEVGKIIDAAIEGLNDNLKNTAFLDALDRASISIEP